MPESERIVIVEALLREIPLTFLAMLASLKATLVNVEVKVPPQKLMAVAPAVKPPENVMLVIERLPLQATQVIVVIDRPHLPPVMVLLVSVIDPELFRFT
jgi:hypothetical protein